MNDHNYSDGYAYKDASLNPSHQLLLPILLKELERIGPSRKSAFDLGCGNGSVAAVVSRNGWEVTGVDPSTGGIVQAGLHYPDIRLYVGSTNDDLAARFGTFPIVYSLEVIEHVYDPRLFARRLFDLLESGGTAILSTPYHGYWKNLALALSGRLDDHFTALWDHGHIKFWSMRTLSKLLMEAGFNRPRYLRLGRIPPLAKSMVAIASKPLSGKADRYHVN